MSGDVNYRFYSHVNYSVTKIENDSVNGVHGFYSHVNYSVTKIAYDTLAVVDSFTVT